MDRPKPRSQLLFLGGELYCRAPFRFGGGDGRIAPWLGNTTLACASKSLLYPSRRSFGFLFRKALGGTLIDGDEHLNHFPLQPREDVLRAEAGLFLVDALVGVVNLRLLLCLLDVFGDPLPGDVPGVRLFQLIALSARRAFRRIEVQIDVDDHLKPRRPDVVDRRRRRLAAIGEWIRRGIHREQQADDAPAKRGEAGSVSQFGKEGVDALPLNAVTQFLELAQLLHRFF